MGYSYIENKEEAHNEWNRINIKQSYSGGWIQREIENVDRIVNVAFEDVDKQVWNRLPYFEHIFPKEDKKSNKSK